jgi:hypothetical protein
VPKAIERIGYAGNNPLRVPRIAAPGNTGGAALNVLQKLRVAIPSYRAADASLACGGTETRLGSCGVGRTFVSDTLQNLSPASARDAKPGNPLPNHADMRESY